MWLSRNHDVYLILSSSSKTDGGLNSTLINSLKDIPLMIDTNLFVAAESSSRELLDVYEVYRKSFRTNDTLKGKVVVRKVCIFKGKMGWDTV